MIKLYEIWKFKCDFIKVSTPLFFARRSFCPSLHAYPTIFLNWRSWKPDQQKNLWNCYYHCTKPIWTIFDATRVNFCIIYKRNQQFSSHYHFYKSILYNYSFDFYSHKKIINDLLLFGKKKEKKGDKLLLQFKLNKMNPSKLDSLFTTTKYPFSAFL